MKVFAKLAKLAPALGALAVATAAVASPALGQAAATVSPHGQALPTAAEIIGRHVAAIGGMPALARVSSMHTVGTLSVPAVGLNAATTSSMAVPNRLVSSQNIPGLGELKSGFDGTTVWSVNPMQGPRVLTGKEADQQKEQAIFGADAWSFAPSLFGAQEALGVVDFNGEPAYKVRMAFKATGTPVVVYFSVAKGWAVGMEMKQSSEMGEIQLVTISGDYKEFDGIKLPTRTEVSMGPTKMIQTLDRVVFNAVPDSAFTIPDPIKALVKK